MGDLEYSFRGYQFGCGLNGIEVSHVSGLIGTPAVSTADEPISNADGLYAGEDLFEGRSIVFAIEYTPGQVGTTLAAQRAALTAAFTKDNVERPLTFQLPGSTARRVYVRVRDVAIDIDQAFAIGRIVRGSIEFAATDPLIYSDTLRTLSIAPPTGEGGLTFNVSGNWSFGAVGTGGTGLLTNDGNHDAPWVATINGPVTDPRLELVATGEILRYTGTIAAGETVVLDSATGAVMLNGTADRSPNLTLANWFALPPGTSQVNYRVASGTGVVDFAWRDASEHT